MMANAVTKENKINFLSFAKGAAELRDANERKLGELPMVAPPNNIDLRCGLVLGGAWLL